MRKITGILMGLFMVLAVAKPCTNILVTPGATKEKASMVTYAADAHVLYGELYFWPAEDHAPGDSLEVYEWDTGDYLGKIKQVPHTYKVVGNMNEHQLVIGETTYTGRKELKDSTGIIDYGSLIYITLQRAKTAREAIRVMDELVSEYGYYSTGESFSIADPEEVWIMEMIGKGPGNTGAVWVARKIPDGMISAHANQARITTFPLKDENTIYSADVIDFAREKGYFKGKDKEFSFADAYAPLDFGAQRFCEARVWSVFRRVTDGMEKYEKYAMGLEKSPRMPLWIKPDKKLSLHDVQELMRDHFEGTPMDMTQDIGAGPYQCPYRWRPLVWEYKDTSYFNERAISTQQTGFSFVSQSRAHLPDPVGGILWFGVDDTYSTCYLPMYCGINEVPHSFAVGTGTFDEFTWESAFWTFNFVSNFTYSRYKDMIVDVRAVQQEYENKFITYQPAIDEAVKVLYENNPLFAEQFLTDYSANQAAEVVERWKKLAGELLYKYLDGNPKSPEGEVTHPPYPEFWYRKILEETGDFFKMR